MNKKELKQLLKDSEVKGLKIFDNEVYGIPSSTVLGLIDQLDEPEKGYAEQSPQYLKNILARLRELPLHDREVWLKAIMSEFERDFSHAKWREGYEQGRIEGLVEREKVTIPNFVADIIEEYKEKNAPIIDIFTEKYSDDQYNTWLIRSLNTYDRAARAWLDGYEVNDEEEKQYKAKIIKTKNHINQVQYLCKKGENYFFCGNDIGRFITKFKKRELEQANFDWVFDCPGIEVEEAE